MNYTIEELRDENANEYARVNMLAWKQSYKGIVDDDFLELLNTKEEIKIPNGQVLIENIYIFMIIYNRR